MDAVFQAGTNVHQKNPHPCQLSLVPKLARRNPDRWQCTVEGQNSQPPGIKLISLINIAHHKFSLAGVDQGGDVSGLFHFINQPVPVPHTLYRNLTGCWQTIQKRAVAFSVMLYPLRWDNLSGFADTRKYRVFLVGITSDIIFHAAVPPSLVFCSILL